MKRDVFFKSLICAAFAGFIFSFGALAARAQNVQPFVDCVERERDNSGELTGRYIAHFGYINYGPATSFIPLNNAGNVLSPVRNPPNQPENFLPGVHPRAISVTLDPAVTGSETWRLSTYIVTASTISQNLTCGGEGQNTRLTTYQGKLNDGNTAASGVYDLQFQLFNAQTGGTARTTPILLEDVPVTNGVFTVQLNLGANATVNPTGRTQALNAAILAGEDGFFEIGVRPGNSTGDFTILTPRQPLTAVPLAMRAETANNAVRAALADNADKLGDVAANQYVKTNDSRLSDARTPTAGNGNYIQNTTAQQTNSNFNISGSGTVGGTLTANTVSANTVLTNTLSASGANIIGTLSANTLNVAGGGAVGSNLTVGGNLNAAGNVITNGNLFAVGGGENLRVVRGVFQVSSGTITILSGTGFSVTRNSAGNYSINFTTAFSGYPSVIPSVVSGATIIGTSNLGVAGTTITAYTINGNPADPSYITFIAIGPK